MSKIKCLKCNEIIESKHRHDFKFCKCENVFIDGGKDYLRCGGNGSIDGTAEVWNEEKNKWINMKTGE